MMWSVIEVVSGQFRDISVGLVDLVNKLGNIFIRVVERIEAYI